MRVEPGTVIGGDFLIERFLKAGGMGDVYVARQLSTEKQRALKLMKAELTRDPRSQERFKQEAKVAAKIDSINVVEVVSAGFDETTGRPWLAMELLNGDDLRTYVEKHYPLSAGTLVRIYEQMCRALAKAHEAGIVHRDLKPENIFLVESREPGQPFTVKVLDFGIAKIIADYNSQSVGTVQIGTPMWMAPEQTETSQTLTAAADIWPLGLMAFWILTGQYYWRSAEKPPISVLAIMRELVSGPLEPASRRATDLGCADKIPPGFDEWFARCVDRDPARRFATAPEAAAQLSLIMQAYRISQRGQSNSQPLQSDGFRGALQTPPLVGPVHRKGPPIRSLLLAGGIALAALVGIVIGVNKFSTEYMRGVCNNTKAKPIERAQACLRLCDKGALEQCQIGGDIILSQKGERREPVGREAVRAFKIACEGRLAIACSRLAKVYEEGAPGVPRNPSQALDLYLQACESGVLRDCVAAGQNLLTSDPKQAREQFKTACDKGEASGCGELGMALLADKGADKDEKVGPKAMTLFQQGCEKGDVTSCLELGRSMEEGTIFHKNEGNALAAYKEACERGSYFGCTQQARLLQDGRGVPKDDALAEKLYREACEKKEALACVGLAHYELRGTEHTPKNPVHARSQLAHYCETEKLVRACLELGVSYRDGIGGERQAKQAKQYFDLACKGGLEEACAIVLPDPPPTPSRPVCPNVEKIGEQCEASGGESCIRSGAMYEKGQCAKQQLCEAHRLYKVGCITYHYGRSCEEHNRFHLKNPNMCSER